VSARPKASSAGDFGRMVRTISGSCLGAVPATSRATAASSPGGMDRAEPRRWYRSTRATVRSLALGRTLRDSGILASMGSRGAAHDNAACESFMASIKTELVKGSTFKTRDEARLVSSPTSRGSTTPSADTQHAATARRSNTRRCCSRIVHLRLRSNRKRSTETGNAS